MGLDIYLWTVEDHAASQAHWAAWEAMYDSVPDWGALSDEEKAAKRAELPEDVSHTDVPSERYPDHLFNRRYLRSSYNGSGFNHAVPDMLATASDGKYPEQIGSLYWIFEPMDREWDGDDGLITGADVPKLLQCRARAVEVAEKLKAADPLRVTDVSTMVAGFGGPDHMWRNYPTADEVLAWYREEKQRHVAMSEKQREMFGEGYSNAKGTVWGFESGMEVLATTVGRDVLGRPAAMLVYRQNKEGHESYIQSAEIVVEFIDEALMLIERDSMAHLSWSG
jgi:hypothetical protein